jgi:hypothetical protein
MVRASVEFVHDQYSKAMPHLTSSSEAATVLERFRKTMEMAL